MQGKKQENAEVYSKGVESIAVERKEEWVWRLLKIISRLKHRQAILRVLPLSLETSQWNRPQIVNLLCLKYTQMKTTE